MRTEKKKRMKKQQDPVNELMKFALTTSLMLSMAIAYKKGYDDAKHGRKNRLEAFDNGR